MRACVSVTIWSQVLMEARTHTQVTQSLPKDGTQVIWDQAFVFDFLRKVLCTKPSKPLTPVTTSDWTLPQPQPSTLTLTLTLTLT